MSVYLQEVLVIATTASGSCEMAVEISVADALHGALPLGSAISGDCRYGSLSDPLNALPLASVSPLITPSARAASAFALVPSGFSLAESLMSGRPSAPVLLPGT